MDRGGHLEGRYANYFEIGHNAFEFVIDCGQVYGSQGIPRFHTRLVVNPAHVVELRELLDRSLVQYEATIGRIHKLDDDE